MNYWVISALVLVFGSASAYAYRRGWIQLALLFIGLETEARKSRARQAQKDRQSSK